MRNGDNYNAADFYDDLSADYDEMFGFEKDLAAAEKFVSGLKTRFRFEKALDIGCGTGSFTLALTRGGTEAVGMDLSGAMLEEARKNSLAYGLDIAFVHSGMEDILTAVSGKFDLILCMGNTLPHLPDKKALDSMLAACGKLLNPGGHLVLNLLNYRKILDRKERLVGISRSGEREFIRFYDFAEPYLRFNILEIDWTEKTPSHKLLTTQLYPYTCRELKAALSGAGFEVQELSAGLDFADYQAEKSNSLTLIAKISAP
jgi:SAM-dependent methyltransferase